MDGLFYKEIIKYREGIGKKVDSEYNKILKVVTGGEYKAWNSVKLKKYICCIIEVNQEIIN